MTPQDLESAGWKRKGRRWISPYTNKPRCTRSAALIEGQMAEFRTKIIPLIETFNPTPNV